jgi:hypothetical protein
MKPIKLVAAHPKYNDENTKFYLAVGTVLVPDNVASVLEASGDTIFLTLNHLPGMSFFGSLKKFEESSEKKSKY